MFFVASLRRFDFPCINSELELRDLFFSPSSYCFLPDNAAPVEFFLLEEKRWLLFALILQPLCTFPELENRLKFYVFYIISSERSTLCCSLKGEITLLFILLDQGVVDS